jgi:hypothetical protein
MAKRTAPNTNKRSTTTTVTASRTNQTGLHEDLNRWSIRLEDSVDRFSKAVTDLMVNAATQAQRLMTIEESLQKHRAEVAALRESHGRDYRDLNDRITAVQSELSDKIAKQTVELTTFLETAADKRVLIAESKEAKEQEEKKLVQARLRTLETWRLMIVGGAIVMGFVLTGVFARITWLVVEKNIFNWFPSLQP